MTPAVMERQIRGDRKPRVNICGDCGIVIGANELCVRSAAYPSSWKIPTRMTGGTANATS